MKKVLFDLEEIADMYQLKIGEGGIGEALFEAAMYWDVDSWVGVDTYGFDDCFKKACDDFRKALNVTDIPDEYYDQLVDDTTRAMRDSTIADYENAVLERIIDLAIKTVKEGAPCKVSKVYPANAAGEKCADYEAVFIAAEVSEKEARKVIMQEKGTWTYNEYIYHYDVEETLRYVWEVDKIEWRYWDYYGDPEKYFDECFDSEAIYTAQEEKRKHEKRLKAWIKNKVPLHVRQSLFA